MKAWIRRMGLMMIAVCMTAGAAPVLSPPTNPPPQVSLGWTASTDPTVTNYFIWYGVASGQYTNKTAVGNGTQATVTLPARGATYYFAATAYSSAGLESVFSNEVNWTPANPPGAPGLKPPVTLAVQTKPDASAQWADAGMNWSLSPDQANALFRLQVVAAAPVPMVTAAPISRTRRIPAAFPPLPGSQ